LTVGFRGRELAADARYHTGMAPSRFNLCVAAISLLVTLVMAAGIWDSYFPDPDAEGLRARRAYYESVLKQANVSWREGLYYKAVDGKSPEARP
jgi:hypothetical protein